MKTAVVALCSAAAVYMAHAQPPADPVLAPGVVVPPGETPDGVPPDMRITYYAQSGCSGDVFSSVQGAQNYFHVVPGSGVLSGFRVTCNADQSGGSLTVCRSRVGIYEGEGCFDAIPFTNDQCVNANGLGGAVRAVLGAESLSITCQPPAAVTPGFGRCAATYFELSQCSLFIPDRTVVDVNAQLCQISPGGGSYKITPTAAQDGSSVVAFCTDSRCEVCPFNTPFGPGQCRENDPATGSASLSVLCGTPPPSPAPSASSSAAPSLAAPLPSASNTPAPSASNTPAPSASNTPGPSASNTPAPSASNTPAPSASNTPAPSASNTPAPSASNTPAPSASNTPAPSASSTPTAFPSQSAPPSPPNSPAPLPSASSSSMPMPEPSLAAPASASPEAVVVQYKLKCHRDAWGKRVCVKVMIPSSLPKVPHTPLPDGLLDREIGEKTPSEDYLGVDRSDGRLYVPKLRRRPSPMPDDSSSSSSSA